MKIIFILSTPLIALIVGLALGLGFAIGTHVGQLTVTMLTISGVI